MILVLRYDCDDAYAMHKKTNKKTKKKPSGNRRFYCCVVYKFLFLPGRAHEVIEKVPLKLMGRDII